MRLKTICQYVALAPFVGMLWAFGSSATTAQGVDDQPIAENVQNALHPLKASASGSTEKLQDRLEQTCARNASYVGKHPFTEKMTVAWGSYFRARQPEWSRGSDCP